MVRRAETAQTDMWIIAQPLQHGLGEARFADAGLTRYQYDRAIAAFYLLPSPHQQLDLLVAAEQWRSGRKASKRLSTAFAPMTRQTGTGSLKPVMETLPRARYSKSPPTRRRVLPSMTTVSGSASACSREARLGVSPTTPCSCDAPSPMRSPTITKPVAMPTRTRNLADRPPPSPATAATNASPAHTARSASSSSARG